LWLGLIYHHNIRGCGKVETTILIIIMLAKRERQIFKNQMPKSSKPLIHQFVMSVVAHTTHTNTAKPLIWRRAFTKATPEVGNLVLEEEAEVEVSGQLNHNIHHISILLPISNNHTNTHHSSSSILLCLNNKHQLHSLNLCMHLLLHKQVIVLLVEEEEEETLPKAVCTSVTYNQWQQY
jgi:hypothetical protein